MDGHVNLNELIPLISTFDGRKVMPKPNKVVRPWKREEDEKLLQAVEIHGTKKWHLVAQSVPNRTRKQCRERYFNHLDPEIKKKPWTDEEDRILIEARKEYGNRWTLIKNKLVGRTANQVKNRYFSKFAEEEELKDKAGGNDTKSFTSLQNVVSLNRCYNNNTLSAFTKVTDLSSFVVI